MIIERKSILPIKILDHFPSFEKIGEILELIVQKCLKEIPSILNTLESIISTPQNHIEVDWIRINGLKAFKFFIQKTPEFITAKHISKIAELTRLGMFEEREIVTLAVEVYKKALEIVPETFSPEIISALLQDSYFWEQHQVEIYEETLEKCPFLRKDILTLILQWLGSDETEKQRLALDLYFFTPEIPAEFKMKAVPRIIELTFSDDADIPEHAQLNIRAEFINEPRLFANLPEVVGSKLRNSYSELYLNLLKRIDGSIDYYRKLSKRKSIYQEAAKELEQLKEVYPPIINETDTYADLIVKYDSLLKKQNKIKDKYREFFRVR